MKCHRQLDEIWLIFYHTMAHFIRKICLLFSRKFCSEIHPSHLTQSSSYSICFRTCYRCAHFIQLLLVINACVADRVFLSNNFPDSRKVQVKTIKVSSSRRWHFLTATSAIKLASLILLPVNSLVSWPDMVGKGGGTKYGGEGRGCKIFSPLPSPKIVILLVKS